MSNYRLNPALRGMGDSFVAPPPANVSQFAIVECGWGQKSVDHGPNAPNTCAFDPAVAIAQAWQVPGVYVSMFGPAGLSSNAYSAIGWGIIAAAGYFFFGGKR